jgi:DNA-binding CsgD family transcriptional regulator
MYGEVRRHHMPTARLHRLRRELADCLSKGGAQRREDLLLIASLQLATGDVGDPDTLTRAAKRAREMYDLDLAARLATAAMEAGGGVDAGLVLAVTHFATGAHAAADQLLTQLADQCAGDSERAAIANARAYNRGVLMGDPEGALEVVAAARRQITDSSADAVLAARAAMMRLFAGDPAAALDESQPSIRSDDQVAATRGYFVATVSLALLGRAADAVTLTQRAIEVARACGGGTQIPEAQWVGGVLGHEAAGELRTAEQVAVAGYQATLEAGDKEGMATFSLLTGKVRVELGELAASARAFREGAAINRELKDETALRWCLGGLALATGMAGDAVAATAAAEELESLGTDWVEIYRPDLMERGRAWASIASGEPTTGRRILRDAADRARGMSMLVAEAHLLDDLARLGEPGAVRSRLAELAGRTDGALVPALAVHATALASNEPKQLDEASTRLADIGAMRLAMETARAAEVAYQEAGHSRQASAAARRADSYAATTGVPVPGRREPVELDRLTAREREIAGLAAGGSSSKDIASRLFISQRTVDNHLQRIYTKLGVNGRDGLRDLLATN